ncbi:B3 domain-containing protein-like protein [Salvia divinorum]|uniref:B3 domain-containing protein-like protein n=1 Tax=Salvia divinorum TaxID=28513 RepID=A0ABD1GLM0_SALDI
MENKKEWFCGGSPVYFDPLTPPDTTLRLILRGTVINATPLRWAFPANIKPRKQKRQDEAHQRSTRRRRIINQEDDERELVPTHGLLLAIESRGGSRQPPVFLFKKKLEKSDIGTHHNRLMVTMREKVMEFLTKEEAAAVEDGGLGIVGVDDIGNVYHELMLKKWASLDMMVVNSRDWNKLVSNNKPIKGDVLEVWGYRENHKPCFAFYFRVRLELTL